MSKISLPIYTQCSTAARLFMQHCGTQQHIAHKWSLPRIISFNKNVCHCFEMCYYGLCYLIENIRQQSNASLHQRNCDYLKHLSHRQLPTILHLKEIGKIWYLWESLYLKLMQGMVKNLQGHGISWFNNLSWSYADCRTNTLFPKVRNTTNTTA